MQDYGFKTKTFIPISFDGSTGTQYATWLANVKFLFWALETKESVNQTVKYCCEMNIY